MSWPGQTKPERLLDPRLNDTKAGEFYTDKWIEIDLGKSDDMIAPRVCEVTGYGLRHGCDKPMYFQRNWQLQGRNSEMENWKTLDGRSDCRIWVTYLNRVYSLW